MNKSSLITIGLVVIAIIAVVSKSINSSNKDADPMIGQTIMAQADTTKISNIEISRDNDHKVSLVMDEKHAWHLQTDNFPADAAKILQFIENLTSAKIVRKMGTNKEIYPSLGLDNATNVVIKAKDQELLHIKIGSQRKGGGAYISLNTNDNSYLLSKNLSVFADANDWELKVIANVESKDIKTVEFISKSATSKLTRESADKDFLLDGIKEGEELNKSSANALANILTGIRYTSRVESDNALAKNALEQASKAIITTYDGRTYTVTVGKVGEKDSEKWYVHIDSAGGKEDNENFKTYAFINSKWSFEVSSYIAQKFIKSRTDFIVPPAKAKNG
ncbi:MAG: DUF4340 domain-containing protein [Bdellovibrionota bacterium]